jgi:hypothetical protein
MVAKTLKVVSSLRFSSDSADGVEHAMRTINATAPSKFRHNTVVPGDEKMTSLLHVGDHRKEFKVRIRRRRTFYRMSQYDSLWPTCEFSVDDNQCRQSEEVRTRLFDAKLSPRDPEAEELATI